MFSTLSWLTASLTWLATEREKVAYFTGGGVSTAHLPSLTFRSADEETVRYFPDKLPIGVGSRWPDIRLSVSRDAQHADGLSPVPRAARRAAPEPAGVDHPVAGATTPGRRCCPPPRGVQPSN